MWSSPEIVTVIIKKDRLYCTLLRHSKKDTLAFTLRAYQLYTLDFIFMTHTSLLNTTYLNSCIRDFLHRNALKNAFVLLGFSSDSLYENYYWVDPELAAITTLQQENTSLVWNYCALDHTHDTKDRLVYVYGLSRSLLFQYQLAALTVPFNCIFITSVQRALLQLLWSVRGAKSSTEVVSGQLLDFRHCLKSFIEFLDYKKNVNGHDYSENEIEALCASMGLYLLGENYESI